MFDTHAHLLPMTEKGVLLSEILVEASREGISGILDVGITPDDIFERSRALAPYDCVRFAAGLHPTEITAHSARNHFETLVENLGNATENGSALQSIKHRIIAIGEIGLDYYWDSSTADLQREILVDLFALAAQRGLPVILHNRESEQDMLDLVRRERPRGVMHCFSQDRAYCKELLDLGMFISFGGNLTYKKSGSIREAAVYVPKDRLLVETDSPYLSPQDVRGTVNHPGHLGFTIQALAAIRDTTPQEIVRITTENANHLF